MRKEENVATFTISKKTEEEIAQKKTASEKTNPPSGAFNISKKTDSAPVYAPTLEEERANERDKMLTPSVSRQAGKTSAPQSAPKRSLGSRVTSGIMSGLITEGANIANAGGVQADLRGGTEKSFRSSMQACRGLTSSHAGKPHRTFLLTGERAQRGRAFSPSLL